jgi:hypothetical protein
MSSLKHHRGGTTALSVVKGGFILIENKGQQSAKFKERMEGK